MSHRFLSFLSLSRCCVRSYISKALTQLRVEAAVAHRRTHTLTYARNSWGGGGGGGGGVTHRHESLFSLETQLVGIQDHCNVCLCVCVFVCGHILVWVSLA